MSTAEIAVIVIWLLYIALSRASNAQPAKAQPRVSQPAKAQPTVSQPAKAQPAKAQATVSQRQNPIKASETRAASSSTQPTVGGSEGRGGQYTSSDGTPHDRTCMGNGMENSYGYGMGGTGYGSGMGGGGGYAPGS
jgi:hypothetical protein